MPGAEPGDSRGAHRFGSSDRADSAGFPWEGRRFEHDADTSDDGSADPALLHVLAYQSVVAHAHAFGLALIFFGVECLLIGHLIRRSGFFPAAIGVLMQLAGLCYLVNSFSMILSPALQGMLFPFILLPSLVGETTFCLWLLIKGVDVAAWTRRANPMHSEVAP